MSIFRPHTATVETLPLPPLPPPVPVDVFGYGLQTTFSELVGLDTLRAIRGKRFSHARIDVRACASTAAAQACQQEALDAGLKTLCIVNRTTAAWVTGDVEVENELQDTLTPAKYLEIVAAVVAARVGMDGTVYAGAASNISPKTLTWLAAVVNGLPVGVAVSTHWYPDGGSGPVDSHPGYASREAQADAFRRVVGARPWIVSEFGYNDIERTPKAAAEGWAYEWDFWHRMGARAAYGYQLNDGPTATTVDSHYGIRAFDVPEGWKPTADTVPFGAAPAPLAMHVVVRKSNGAYPEHIRGAIGRPEWSRVGVPLSYYMLEFLAPSGFAYGQPVSMVIQGDDCTDLHLEVPFAPDMNVIVQPAFVALPRLIPNGQYLRLDTGEPWTAIECSDFNLLARSYAGEDIEPLLTQRATVGFNLLRVWTAYSIDRIGRLVPNNSPGLYAHIPVFLQQCARHGLYVELTAFTGPYTGLFDNADEMVAHWESLITACQRQTNVYLELVNEADNAPNQGLPMDRLRRPTGVIASHGSNIQDSTPVTPFWDLATYRASSGEWQRKIGHNADEISDTIPVITNETVRCPDSDSDPHHFEDGAAGATLLCAGACFHSVCGKNSTLWSGQELVCAQAWVTGAKKVPLSCQPGNYTHRTDLETAEIIRAYQRGNETACIVTIRA